MFDDLRCPLCGYESEPIQRLQQKGFNIVTCGMCGGVFIHETKH